MKLTAKGVSSHGSVPMLEQNAVVKMARVINGLARYRPHTVLTEETQRFYRQSPDLTGLTMTSPKTMLMKCSVRFSDKAIYLIFPPSPE